MDERDQSFLARWSRLKRSGGEGRREEPSVTGEKAPGSDVRTPAEGSARAKAPPVKDPPAAPAEIPLEEIERIDISTLDAQSDFKPFLQSNVPAELRGKALARLWTTDATLASPDPFFEYGGNYTDAAVCVAGGIVQTAYKVGQGFLSDEEAAEWDRLGTKPEGESVTGTRPDLVIAEESPDQPAVREFFAESEAYMAALYPAASNHFVSIETLSQPGVVFLVVRRRAKEEGHRGEAVGCGALVPASDGNSAEIKRMWVTPSARRRGFGRELLRALEDAARKRAITVLRLETGIAQPEAISLYRSAGFLEREAFAPYKPDPLSLFMEKRLA